MILHMPSAPASSAVPKAPKRRSGAMKSGGVQLNQPTRRCGRLPAAMQARLQAGTTVADDPMAKVRVPAADMKAPEVKAKRWVERIVRFQDSRAR